MRIFGTVEKFGNLEEVQMDSWTELRPNADFKPFAEFFPRMDAVLYLREDCSYVADRVDAFLTVLWHPTEERLVGIKLKGFRFLFNQVQAIAGLDPSAFIPLVRVLETALVGGVAESLISKLEKDRIHTLYEQARAVVGDAHAPPLMAA